MFILLPYTCMEQWNKVLTPPKRNEMWRETPTHDDICVQYFDYLLDRCDTEWPKGGIVRHDTLDARSWCPFSDHHTHRSSWLSVRGCRWFPFSKQTWCNLWLLIVDKKSETCWCLLHWSTRDGSTGKLTRSHRQVVVCHWTQVTDTLSG